MGSILPCSRQEIDLAAEQHSARIDEFAAIVEDFAYRYRRTTARLDHLYSQTVSISDELRKIEKRCEELLDYYEYLSEKEKTENLEGATGNI